MKVFRRSLIKELLPIALISCLGIIVYSNTFYCSFHFDDEASIVNNFFIRNISNLQNIWNFLPRRFILHLSLALNYYFNGLNVIGYHIFNLVIHIGAAILVWWLTLLTFSTPVMKEDKIFKHTNLVALLAGLVFVSHPVQTEAVTYIVQRTASMAAFFYLASLCLYVQSRLLDEKKSTSSLRRIYYISSLITAIMAMFTKETAITLPLMVLFYEFSFFKMKRSFNWGRLIPLLLTLFIIPLTMLLTESGAARLQQLRSEPGISSMHYLLTQFRVIITYIRLAFLPLNQNFDYDYPVYKNIFEIPVLVSFLSLAAILYWAKHLFSKYRLLSFSIFWFFLTLLPESSFFPIKDVIYEHRLYLPLVGYSIFLVGGLYYLFGEKNIKMMVKVLLIIITVNSILTYQRNKIWKDEITLWEDGILKSPHKARPYINLGDAYEAEGNHDQAIAEYGKAIELNPKLAGVYINRGDVYVAKGNYDHAISDYNKAIEVDPDDVQAYDNRGSAYVRQGYLDQALLDYNKAIKINPTFAVAFYNRALVYVKQGDMDQALSDFNKTIEIDHGYKDAYNNRGLYYSNQGNFTQALSDFNQVIEIDPTFAAGFYNRALVYNKQGNLTQAISDYSKAIELNPNYAEAYNDLGSTYYNNGNYDQAIFDYNKAIELNPNYVEAYFSRGAAYGSKGNFAQTISDCNKAIELNPNFTQAYNNRAAAYFKMKEYNKAWEDVHVVEKLGATVDPDFISALKAASNKAK